MDQINRNPLALWPKVQEIFGPAFPEVDFMFFDGPLRIEVFGINHRGVELIFDGEKFVQERGATPDKFWVAPSPHEFDFGHFHECCQAVQALLGAQVVLRASLPGAAS